MTQLIVTAIPSDVEVTAGADIATLLLEAAHTAGVVLQDGDVLAVASKVVAKAEGAVVPLPQAPDHHAARRLLARDVARRIVADTPHVLVVETHHGFVCANAGIDTSNLPGGEEAALLLPHDPDASAATIRTGVTDRTGLDVGVLITDTFGRPWRLGLTDVALGAAGVEVLRDERGTVDRDGRTLDVTMIATADQLAAAADLVRTKSSGTPFVLLRGLQVTGPAAATARASDLLRDSDSDVFRTGGPTAGLDLLDRARPLGTRPGPLPVAPTDALLAPVVRAVRDLTGDTVEVGTDLDQPPSITLVGDAAARGAAATTVCVAAAAHGWRCHVEDGDTTTVVVVGSDPSGG